MKRKILLLTIFFGCINLAIGQFSSQPLGLLPMQYNDAFAGSAGDSRICANGTYLYLNNGYGKLRGNGFYASFDRFYPVIRSGLGISVNRFFQTVNYDYPSFESEYEYEENQIAVALAPKISIKGKYTISTSINLSFNNRSIFGENHFFENGENNGISSRLGMLFNTKRFYAGYAVRLYEADGLKMPAIYNYDFYSVLQLGFAFQKTEDSRFSFTPQLAMIIKGKAYPGDRNVFWPQYNFGFRYNSWLFSLFTRIEYFIPTGFSLGWQKDGFRVMISNDFSDPYRADLTLRYIFNQDKNSKFIQY